MFSDVARRGMRPGMVTCLIAALAILIGFLLGMFWAGAQMPQTPARTPFENPADRAEVVECDECSRPALPLRRHDGARRCAQHKHTA